MAFVPYIIIDGYRYKTLAKQWRPMTSRAASARLTLQGNLESTFGVGALRRWEGLVIAPHGESAPGAADGSLHGNIYTLRLSLAKTTPLSFTDHNQITFSQAVFHGPFDEQTLQNVWDAASNKYYVRVSITAQA